MNLLIHGLLLTISSSLYAALSKIIIVVYYKFYPPHLIGQELDKVFTKLHSEKMLHETDRKHQIEHLSYIMSELNIIHPFREGNGRSIRELIRCMALYYGFSLDWSCVDRDMMLDAAIRSVVDDRAFCDVIVKCVVEG